MSSSVGDYFQTTTSLLLILNCILTQLYFRNAITSRVPEYLSSQFIKRGEISRRATRRSQMLNIPLFKSANDQKTFYYRIVSIWNSMDSHFKTFESVCL